MTILSRELGSVAVGDPLTFRNMTIFALTQPMANKTDYVSLVSALSSGAVSVQETSDSGTVPIVRLQNRGEHLVLLVDGEELVGAKQNRILNLTILAPARATVDIPVTCVEAGRWARRSGDFSVSNRTAYAALRAKKMGHIARNMAYSASRAADQGAAWDDIALKSARMGTRSQTQAMSDIYSEYDSELQAHVDSFRPICDQVGAIFAVNGRVAGMEYFESTDLFSELMPKLVRSYALDAIEADLRPFVAPERSHAVKFVDAITRVDHLEEFPAIGLGHDIRFADGVVIGSALRLDDRLLHLSGFPADSSKGTQRHNVHTRHGRLAQVSFMHRPSEH